MSIDLTPAVKRAFAACKATDRAFKKLSARDVLAHEKHRDTLPGDGEHCNRKECPVHRVQLALRRQRNAIAKAEGKGETQ